MSAIGLYAKGTEGFAGRLAHTVALLQGAAHTHLGRIVQASSLLLRVE